MPDSNDQYLKLITYEHANKPLFSSYVEAYLKQLSEGTELPGSKTTLYNGAVNCLNALQSLFNVDTAQGAFLDKVGALVGISRVLPVDDPDIPAKLDDDSYRLVIKAKMLRNHWDGTLGGIADMFTELFPQVSYTILDNQDMTMSIAIISAALSDEEKALITNGLIFPKPSGVEVNYTITSDPVFGWDLDTTDIKGYDEGTWVNY